jgi:hypothetical protein
MTASRSSSSDRRGNKRFEPVQELWGTLEFTDQLVVRDLSEGGVGIEASRPIPTGTVLALRLGSDGHASHRHARVVYATAVQEGRAGPTYRVGLEFLDYSMGDTDTRSS